MTNPKISILMGIYNCGDTLAEAIDSILAQTYSNWELILCDDGSSDNTYEVAESYKNKYPDKIILIKNEENLKLPRTLNHCLEYATGELAARMDGDDRSHPDRFMKQVNYLINHPDYDLVGTGMVQFDDSGETGYRPIDEHPTRDVIGYGSPFNHATIVIKTEVLRKLNGYSLEPYVIRCEDVDLWMRFFHAGYKGANIDEPLYYVREDINTEKRRKKKDSFRVAKMLYINYKKFDYPKKQYKYVLRPIISCLTPRLVKRAYHRIIYNKQEKK